MASSSQQVSTQTSTTTTIRKERSLIWNDAAVQHIYPKMLKDMADPSSVYYVHPATMYDDKTIVLCNLLTDMASYYGADDVEIRAILTYFETQISTRPKHFPKLMIQLNSLTAHEFHLYCSLEKNIPLHQVTWAHCMDFINTNYKQGLLKTQARVNSKRLLSIRLNAVDVELIPNDWRIGQILLFETGEIEHAALCIAFRTCANRVNVFFVNGGETDDLYCAGIENMTRLMIRLVLSRKSDMSWPVNEDTSVAIEFSPRWYGTNLENKNAYFQNSISGCAPFAVFNVMKFCKFLYLDAHSNARPLDLQLVQTFMDQISSPHTVNSLLQFPNGECQEICCKPFIYNFLCDPDKIHFPQIRQTFFLKQLVTDPKYQQLCTLNLQNMTDSLKTANWDTEINVFTPEDRIVKNPQRFDHNFGQQLFQRIETNQLFSDPRNHTLEIDFFVEGLARYLETNLNNAISNRIHHSIHEMNVIDTVILRNFQQSIVSPNLTRQSGKSRNGIQTFNNTIIPIIYNRNFFLCFKLFEQQFQKVGNNVQEQWLDVMLVISSTDDEQLSGNIMRYFKDQFATEHGMIEKIVTLPSMFELQLNEYQEMDLIRNVIYAGFRLYPIQPFKPAVQPIYHLIDNLNGRLELLHPISLGGLIRTMFIYRLQLYEKC